MTYDYFYGQQAEMFAFYRVPKVLFTEDCFWNVSTDAKLLYGILLDRMNLSARNGWLDEEGRVYIIFTIEEIKGALGCAEKKAVKLLDELEKKCGLIERKRQGLGKPNLIYVKNFISGSVERQFLNCQKDNSGVVKNTIQELSKAQGNNTDTNYIDFSDTDPFFPSGFCGKEVDETDEFTRYYQYFYEQLSMDYLKQDYPYDHVYGGRLPVHVRCLIDEAANIGQIPNLEKLVATIRSREISACLVLQAQSQLKAIYKDNSDTIIGNMDSRIFLGGSEPTTLKELNQALGKETIDTYNTSNTRGNSPSYGMNYQKLGKDLATVDELAVLDGGKCILQLRGVRPFLSDKYDLTQHPNYKYTSDYDKKNEFNIEQFLSRRLKLKAGDEFVVVDAD